MNIKKDTFKPKPKVEKPKRYKITSKMNAISTFKNPLIMRFKQIKPFESIVIALTSDERKQASMIIKNERPVKRNDIKITEIKE